MARSYSLCALLVAAAIAVVMVARGADAEVVDLTPDNFDTIVMDPTKSVFVKFYAPWCGHCKRMAPVWDELGTSVDGSGALAGRDIVIARLDGSAHRDIAQRYGVRGFPTIRLFTQSNKDAAATYSGPRDLSAFTTYLKEHCRD